MMQTSYKISNVDVFIHEGESFISTEQFYRLEDYFRVESDYFYAKIENAHIPVRPESSVPSNTVVISDADAEEYGIEEEYSRPIFFMNPEVIQWF